MTGENSTRIGRVARGVTWLAGGEAARQVTQFGIGVVLVRILQPSDYGLLAMAAFVIGLLQVLTKCGVSEALIQRKHLVEDDWSSVYWAQVGLGLVVGVTAWVLAPLAAGFYREERVIPVVRALSWNALLEALGGVQLAWLTREMRFRTVAQVEWAGVLAAGTVGVTMAATGWGFWSLVGYGLAGPAVTAALFSATCPWRPAPRLRWASLRSVLRFGLGLQGFGIVNYFNRRLDDALIGRYVGPVGLGHYSRAYALMLYPVQNITAVIGRVMFPALSEMGDDLALFRAAYLRAVSTIASVTFPAMLGLLVTAPEVILVVYGPQWMPVVSILQVLCGVGLLQSVAASVGWIYLARGRTDLMFAWSVGAAAVIWSSFIIGLRWGAMGVAIAYALANGALLVPCLAIPFRLVGLAVTDLFRAMAGSLAGAVVMAGVTAAVRWSLIGEVSPPAVLAASATSGIVVYLAWLCVTGAPAMREARLAWSRIAQPRDGVQG